MNAQLQTFIKYFIHRFDFLNYEMILRTFNCTIVNQIKSSKKLVVKLKIRNMQLVQMKTNFKLFFSRVPLFSCGNKWATVWSWLDHTSIDVKEFLQANVSPGPAEYHLLTTSHWICLVVFSNASWPSFDADGGFSETDFQFAGTLSGNFPRILLFQAIVYLNWQTKYFAALFLSYALLKMQFFLSYFFKRFA